MPPHFVNVAFPLPVDRVFTYRVPETLQKYAAVGSRVLAPFGRRKLTGFVVEFTAQPDLPKIKEIEDVLDLKPLLSTEILGLSKWISGYYLCSFGEALKSTVPASLLTTSKKVVRLSTEEAESHASRIEKTAPRQAQILRYLSKAKQISLNQLKKRIGAGSLVSSLNLLEEAGLLKVSQQFSSSGPKPKIDKYVRLAPKHLNEANIADEIEKLQKSAPKQAECLSHLHRSDKEIEQRELLKAAQAPLSSLKSLEQKSLVERVDREIIRDYYQHIPAGEAPEITLNREQAAALSEIDTALKSGQFQSFLLFGVTGSGKTQVYIEALYEALAAGRDAIVLVPEISLTPQTVRRFRMHFKEKVAVLHSAMSEGERYDSWRRLKDGRCRIAIGPRSAVFAPLRNVGLIVVDEEHEATYKQSDSAPRYHARDVAVYRAQQNDAVVILGSATPSAESYFNARQQKYRLLELRKRVNDVPMPEVKVLDMLKERRLAGKNWNGIFSRALRHGIEERIAKKQQVILLLNRRGFSSYIKCRDCGYIESCEHCNITLTYHLRGRRLRCHYCGFSKRAPDLCPDCHGQDILFSGMGTQKVEGELLSVFPQAKVVRMDLDTTGRKWSHDKILQDFGDKKYDILLGTQMVAKGLDFDNVTLVGVINADVGLLLPDFRSTERSFQLLTQVSGRAGRKDLPGEVIIQTYTPESFCLECACKHDFLSFYTGEIESRRELSYPPYGRMVYILFKGEDENRVAEAARFFSGVLKRFEGPFQILGPIPSPIAKIQDRFRWQVLLKGDKSTDAGGRLIRQTVAQAHHFYGKEAKFRGVQITVDVDPVSIL